MKKFLLALATLLASYVGWKQFQPPTRVYINEELSPENLALAQSLKMKPAYIAYEWTLDRDNDGIWDGPQQADEWLASVPTNAEMITLDWESNAIELVKHGDSAQIAEWLKALNYLKSKRPAAKFGFYDIPSTRYYTRDGSWDVEASNYKPIVDAVDILMPSLYDFYPDTTTANHTEQEDLDFVKWNIEKTLALSDKPTYLYVWHRFHSNGYSDDHSTVIPAQEFINFVQTAANTSVNGKKIKGIIWWGSDLGFFQPWGQGPATDKLLTGECGLNKDVWPLCINNLHQFVIQEELNKIKF